MHGSPTQHTSEGATPNAIDAAGRSVTYGLDPGETVRCVFRLHRPFGQVHLRVFTDPPELSRDLGVSLDDGQSTTIHSYLTLAEAPAVAVVDSVLSTLVIEVVTDDPDTEAAFAFRFGRDYEDFVAGIGSFLCGPDDGFLAGTDRYGGCLIDEQGRTIVLANDA